MNIVYKRLPTFNGEIVAMIGLPNEALFRVVERLGALDSLASTLPFDLNGRLYFRPSISSVNQNQFYVYACRSVWLIWRHLPIKLIELI